MSQLTGHISTNLDLAQDGGPISVASSITAAGFAAIAASGPAGIQATLAALATVVVDTATPYAIPATGNVFAIDATAGAAVVNLPLASAGPRLLLITKKDSAAHNVTITCNAEDTFVTTGTTLALTVQGDFAILVSDPVNDLWYIFGKLLA